MISRVLLTIGLLGVLAMPATVFAQGGVEAGWASSPPSLDGTIGAAEWANGALVTLIPSTIIPEPPVADATGGQGGMVPMAQDLSPAEASGWARFMNDDRYLYLAVSLDIGAPAGDPDWWSNWLWFLFEDEPTIGDGKWAANLCGQNPDEGAYVSGSAYGPIDYDDDYFAPASEDDWCEPFQYDPPGYRRALGWGSTNWELRFDLRTSALDITPGHCFNAGLLVVASEYYFTEEWSGYASAVWPEDWQDEDMPDVLGEVCLAAPEEEEFVPEPGSIALLGTGLAGLGGYATLRWRSRRKE